MLKILVKIVSIRNILFVLLALILLVFVSFGFFAATDRLAGWVNTRAGSYSTAGGNL